MYPSDFYVICHDMNIPGFEFEEKIYQGKSTTVWKARQKSLDRTVAIKVLNPETAKDPKEKEIFLREARITAKVKHPNLVQVFDIGEENGLCFYSMEYAGGPTLEQLLAEKERIPEGQALKITRQLAEALECLWKRAKLIHCNIKPSNVLTTDENTVKLCDFGLVKSTSGENGEQEDELAGTPNYMSPELAAGREIDFRSDIYSLGALLYHAVTGAAPFEDKTDSDAVLDGQRNEQIPNPREVARGIKPSTANLLSKLMMKSPDYRYPNWQEAIQDIKKASKGNLFLMNRKSRALSTIADTEKQAKPARSTAAATRHHELPAFPLLAHVLLWIALLSWWGVFGFYLSKKPPASPLPQENALAAGENGDSGEQAEDISADMRGELEEEARMLTADDETGETSEPVAEQPAATPVSETDKAMQQITELIVSNKLEEASGRLQEYVAGSTAQDKEEAELISKAIAKLSSLDSTVAAHFSDRVGEEVKLHHKGREFPVIVTSVINNRISARTTGENGRDVLFPVSRLEPEEKARWLDFPDSMADHVVRFVLYTRSGNTKRAAEHAATSGPLADTLSDFLASRTEKTDAEPVETALQ